MYKFDKVRYVGSEKDFCSKRDDSVTQYSIVQKACMKYHLAKLTVYTDRKNKRKFKVQ